MRFFDAIAPLYDFFHFGKKQTAERIKELGRFSAFDVVADVGGGTGRVAQLLLPHVKKIIVIDESEKMIGQCQKKTGLVCVRGAAEQLPFADNYFDKIIVVDAFHHFQNQRGAIKEMGRVLKPGGLIIVEEFHPGRLGGRLIIWFENLLRLGSAFYSPEELRAFFNQNNLTAEIFESETKEYYLVAGK